METAQQSSRSWITEGIVLAGIPATAYVWALLYEIAYSSYFFIPWYFISLSSVSVLAITRLYIITMGFLYIWLLMFIASRPLATHLDRFASRSPRNRVIVSFSFLLLMLIILLSWAFFENELLFRIMLITTVVFLIIAFFVTPLFRQHGTKGNYWDKLLADYTPHPRISTPKPSPTSASRDFMEFFAILMTLAVITYGIYLFPTEGRKDAQRHEWFPVVAQSPVMPEVVVLRVYGDNLFAIPFDRSTRVFERQLFILKVSEMGKTPFTMEKVGPLVPPHLPLQPMIVVPPDPR